MKENAAFKLAMWMARRNGRALARSVGMQLKGQIQRAPWALGIQHWQAVLESRRGWKKIRPYVYEFRGERLEIKPSADALDILDWLSNIELKGLGNGMHSELQARLLKEAVLAARMGWPLHMKNP